MNPGLFNKRVSIEKLTSSVNENGFPVEEWQTHRKAWAMIKTLNDKGSSYEFYEAAATYAQNTNTFVIRYTKEIDTSMRITYKGRIFEMISCVNDAEANKTLTIVGKEVI